jgi:digeranylgeranylglycerophospholipid reductase
VGDFDIVVAGGGPGGLSAARSSAGKGARVLLVEQSPEIGSPIRTSGGSFIRDLEAFGIPPRLYHPIHRCRFAAPGSEASFSYADPVLCIMDVRGVYQFLAERAIAAGAAIRLATSALAPIFEHGFVRGLRIRTPGGREESIGCRVLIDATGHRAALIKQAGVHPGFRRFGVGAELDLYAPACDRFEAVLMVGSEVAPAGYAWAFPWGDRRVRVGVGIIHPDSDAAPGRYLDALIANAARFGIDLAGAQPVEAHHGLIPAAPAAAQFAGNGILGAGDAAGQASTFVGEGIRWAMAAGRMAGETAAEAVANGDCSEAFLSRYQTRWKRACGPSLRIAYEINLRISRWDDRAWRDGVELLKLLSPAEFAQALRSDFTPSWMLRLLCAHPSLAKRGLKALIDRVAPPTG